MQHEGIRALAALAIGVGFWLIVGLVFYLDWIKDVPPSIMFD